MQNLNSKEEYHSRFNRGLVNNAKIVNKSKLNQKEIKVRTQIKSNLNKHLFIVFGKYS